LPDVLPPVVELLLQLVLEELPLLLDDEDFFQSLREAPQALGFQRPGHPHLEEADANVRREPVVDAEILERLAHVHVRLARGDDPEPRPRAVDDDAVQVVGAAVRERGVELVVEEPLLLHEERVGPADIEAIRGEDDVGRQGHLHPVGIDIHRGRALDDVGDALERYPAARVARHRVAVYAEVEVLLHRRRVEHRHHDRLEDVIGLVRQRRRLCGVVVAGAHDHAAVLRRAAGVGVAKHIAAPVDARTFPVPQPEHAVVLRAREQVDLLRAPDRRRREVLVDTGLEDDVVLVEELSRPRKRLVEPAER
jgi:hypothetical protein